MKLPAQFAGADYLDVIATAILLVAILILRWFLARSLRKNERLDPAIRRRWLVQIRNATLMFLLVGLVFIWADQLRPFALSLVAVAVALVLATKEILLCVSGAAIRATTDAFGLGDRVEIGETCGEVVDQRWLTTTLLETGPGRGPRQFTGRRVTIPNSLLLTEPVVNQRFIEGVVFHVMTVPLAIGDDWPRAESVLLKTAREHCGPSLPDVRSRLQAMMRQQGIDSPAADPRVIVEVEAPDRIKLFLRFAAPPRQIGRIEQAVLRDFLTHFRGGTDGPIGAPAKKHE